MDPRNAPQAKLAFKEKPNGVIALDRGETPPGEQVNRRNGTTSKRVRTSHGPVEVTIPRDRKGTFEPPLVPKYSRQFGGFDDQILAMYARGLSTRDIQALLKRVTPPT